LDLCGSASKYLIPFFRFFRASVVGTFTQKRFDELISDDQQKGSDADPLDQLDDILNMKDLAPSGGASKPAPVPQPANAKDVDYLDMLSGLLEEAPAVRDRSATLIPGVQGMDGLSLDDLMAELGATGSNPPAPAKQSAMAPPAKKTGPVDPKARPVSVDYLSMLDDIMESKPSSSTPPPAAATAKAAQSAQADYLDMLDDVLNGVAFPPTSPPKSQQTSASSVASVDVSLDELLASMGLDEPAPAPKKTPVANVAASDSIQRRSSADNFAALEATISDLELEWTGSSDKVPAPTPAATPAAAPTPAPTPAAPAPAAAPASSLDLLDAELAALETAVGPKPTPAQPKTAAPAAQAGAPKKMMAPGPGPAGAPKKMMPPGEAGVKKMAPSPNTDSGPLPTGAPKKMVQPLGAPKKAMPPPANGATGVVSEESGGAAKKFGLRPVGPGRGASQSAAPAPSADVQAKAAAMGGAPKKAFPRPAQPGQPNPSQPAGTSEPAAAAGPKQPATAPNGAPAKAPGSPVVGKTLVKAPAPVKAPAKAPERLSQAPAPKPALTNWDALDELMGDKPAPAKTPEPEKQPEPAPAVVAEPEPAPVAAAVPGPVKQPASSPRNAAPTSPAPQKAPVVDEADDFDSVLENMMTAAKKPKPAAPAEAPSAVAVLTPAPEPEPSASPAPQSGGEATSTADDAKVVRGGRKVPAKARSRPVWDVEMTTITLGPQLGKGGWGNTFEGSWRVDPSGLNPLVRNVAVKKTKSTDFSTEAVESFRKEVQEVIKLNHPNLARYLGCGVSDAKYLISEWIDGISCWAHMHVAKGNTTQLWALHICRNIADAMSHLHAANVIHASLKPKNIILDKDMNAVVKDYGFLDIKDSLSPDDVEPAYMAPEYLAGETYTEKIDVYSYGMLMYELFTKRPPWAGMSSDQIVGEVREKLNRPQIPDAIPPVFERLIRACWASSPAERPTFQKISMVLQMSADKLLAGGAEAVAPPGPRAGAAAMGRADPAPASPYSAPAPAGRPTGRMPSMSSPPTLDAAIQAATARPRGDITAAAAAVEDAQKEQTPRRAVDGNFSVRVNKAKPFVVSSGVQLEVEQERKLDTVLSKVAEMVRSGSPETQLRSLSVMTELVKDESRVRYVAKKTMVIRELVELITDLDPNLRPYTAAGNTPYDVVEAVLRAFASFAATSVAMAKSLSDCRAVVPLVELLGRDNEGLVVLAAKVLTELAGAHPTMCDTIRLAGGIFPLTNMLRSSNEFVQVQAAWTLAEVLADETNQNDFLLAGGLRSLLEYAESTNAGLRLRSLDCLSHFVSNEKAKEQVVPLNLKDKFLQMMAANSDVLRSVAIRAFSRFFTDPKFVLSTYEVARIFKTLMERLNTNGVSSREKITILTTFRRMMTTEENLREFRDLGGLTHVIQALMREKDDDLRLLALEVVHFAFHDQRCREAIVAQGGVVHVAVQIQAADTRLRTEALKTLTSLVGFNKEVSNLTSNGVVSRLCSVIAYSPDKTEIQLALRLLLPICRLDEFKADVREAGCISALVDRIQDLDSGMNSKVAALCLANLLSEESCRAVLIESGSLIRFLTYLKDVSKSPKMMDSEATEMLGTALTAIGTLASDDAHGQDLRDGGAPETICVALGHSDVNIIIKALRAILLLLKDPKNKRVIQANAILKLKDLEVHPHPNVPRVAASILEKLQ
jgi:serine/threonine protein kinase/CRISPR/Cas system CSM-associated protein Csm2 small subunit